MTFLKHLSWRAARSRICVRQKRFQIRKLQFHYWIVVISSKFAEIANVEVCQKGKNLEFSFFHKLQHSLSLRVLKIWQGSNNEKTTILIEDFEPEFFSGVLRGMINAFKISLLAIFRSREATSRLNARISTRARKFGLRQRMENQKMVYFMYLQHLHIS